MSDFKIDDQEWRFLDDPASYLQGQTDDLLVEPLARQFKTAKEILSRLANGRGVLLADDVGLGKTTVGALVAWVVALQDKRVRIYAPNKLLQRRWAEELERHVPMLERFGAGSYRIKQGGVGRLHKGRIQVTTHHALVKSHDNREQRTACDLMIIDEAHRAKGDGSAFNEALRNLGDRAKRKLILTATPFSIRLAELEQLLSFAGAKNLDAVRAYAKKLDRLYILGDGHDEADETQQLVNAARSAIKELQPYVIRHGIDDLQEPEQKHFGVVSTSWEIPTAPATEDEIKLLLRMDRLLQLTQERRGTRRNDPRFHIGWQHVRTRLEDVATPDRVDASTATLNHTEAAKKELGVLLSRPHPKIAAVTEAILPLLTGGEKVVVFCHHRATASELLGALEQRLKAESTPQASPSEAAWHEAWESLLLMPDGDPLLRPIIDWLCTPGLRCQIGRWLGTPKQTARDLAEQLKTTRPRHARPGVPTIFEAARRLAKSLVDKQSISTRALLRNMANGQNNSFGNSSHFPGRLDDGFPVMGAWTCDGNSETPETLYTGKPDIVLALFNSPFGPDVLVTTDRLSEGVDLHRYCRHLIHYELDPSPVRTLQRNGRVRRVGSWAARTNQPICYAYPMFGGTRDEKAVGVMRQRIDAFGLLLGGVPSLNDAADDSSQSFAEAVMRGACKDLASLNRQLCVD